MLAEERIVTPTLLLTKVGDTGWEIAEGESGVSFAEFASVVKESLATFRLQDHVGPHISPIAGYNQETRQVLIMDVDREWYVSYWATDQCPRAMLCTATAEHDRFAEGPGHLVWIWPTPAALVSGTHGRQASATPAEDVGGWRRALGERRRS